MQMIFILFAVLFGTPSFGVSGVSGVGCASAWSQLFRTVQPFRQAPKNSAHESPILGRPELKTDVVEFRSGASATKFQLEPLYARVTQELLPAARSLAQKSIREGRLTSDSVNFFEKLDDGVRASSDVPKVLIDVALKRLSFLKSKPFIVILSGGTADRWDRPIAARGLELGLDLRIVKVPGTLSPPNRPGLNKIPPFPAELAHEIARQPVLVVDDSFVKGGTVDVIRKSVQDAGGALAGTFVAFDSSAGNPAALVKAANTTGRPKTLHQFPLRPISWDLAVAKDAVLGVEIFGSLMDARTSKLLPQGQRLLEEAARLGLTVLPESKGKPAPPPRALVLASQELQNKIKFASTQVKPTFSLGPVSEKSPSRQGVISIGTNSSGQYLNPSTVDPDYLLDRLVEAGFLKAVYSNQLFPEAIKGLPGSRSTVDLR